MRPCLAFHMTVSLNRQSDIVIISYAHTIIRCLIVQRIKQTTPLVCVAFTTNKLQSLLALFVFRQDWIIAKNAAAFFFGKNANWTSFTEVSLKDANGKSAGNIDIVLVSYDDKGKVLDFGAIEIQSVYISGNVRNPFATFMNDPESWESVDWSKLTDKHPRPDYLSSFRKRLVPQLLYKGKILRDWGKKQAIVVQKSFFETLPELPQVSLNKAEIAWTIYDLERQEDRFNLVLSDIIYTEYRAALDLISTPIAGKVESFVGVLQKKLKTKLDNLTDIQMSADIPLL